MIKLNGKYSSGADYFLECEVIAKNGHLLPRTRPDITQLQKYIESPKNTESIEIKPTSVEKGILKPSGYNYIIKYIDDNNNKHLIFVGLSPIKLFILNHNLKKNFYQTTEFKITVYGGIILAAIITLVKFIF